MVGLVLVTMLATWASFLVSLVAGRLIVWPAVVVFLIGLGAGAAAFRPPLFRRPSWIYIVTLLGWGLFLIKLFSQMMVVTPEGVWAGGSNVWGDWAGHLGYIANWLYGDNWPPQNPWYAGIRLSYPFLFDYTSAVLAKLGVSISWSLQLPGIVLGLTLVVLLFRLATQLTRSETAAAMAVAIFMLSGGLGWVYLFPGQSILAVPPGGVKELTHSYEGNIQWVNFVISEMVPQRGILLGASAALAVFYLWWEGWKNSRRRSFLASGVIAGLVPFFHAHTFLVLAFVSGVFFLLRPRRLWWYFFLPAGLLALPQMAYFTPQVAGYSAGFARWQPGWAAHVQKDNWLWFWTKNIGPMIILIPLAWYYAWKDHRRLFWLYLPFVGIFIAANLWIFQPWENDNTKLLRFWYLASAILVGHLLDRVSRHSLPGKVAAGGLLVLITLAGAVDAGSWLNFEKNKLMMWSRQDMEMAETIKKITPPDAIFLTTDAHNHWVVDLAGRKIVLGFRGWLWSWGINYADRERDVYRMFQADPALPQLFKKYHINYVIIGLGEREQFQANLDYYLRHYPLVLSGNGQQIFDVGGQN